ncbi:MAG: hypothetical protein IM613_12600 [Cytophagales bacterium]|nr:hypothetical protein [Cytophagales bacterium]
MIIEGVDGETHINIYSKGKTELGRWLSNFTYEPITIEGEGYFPSIESYWYFLRTGGDGRFHKVSGFNAKKLGKELQDDSTPVDPLFIEKIKHSLDLKIKIDKDKMRNFADSMLPFCHYYVFGDTRKDAGYEWIVEHFELRRKQLKDYYGRNYS